MKLLNLPPIVIDSREQRPFAFAGLASERGTLRTGDYSLKGYERYVAIERKGKLDAWQCVADSRVRFERCIERLAALDFALIVIECSQMDFCIRPERIQRVTVATAVGSYLSWMVQYKVGVLWCDNRQYAERTVLRLLASWYKYRAQRFAAAGELAVATAESVR